MDSRSRTLRRISRTTSTSCGIGWHLAATFRRRCDGWTYRRTMVEPGRWGYPRSPIVSPRWWSKEPWSRSWVLLYLERWWRAPVQMADGSLISRDRGTLQGGVVSPLLANLF